MGPIVRTAAAALLIVFAVAGCADKPSIRPSARYATAAAAVDGTVYIVGGLERGALEDATVGTVEAYRPGARTWTRCAPMPTPRSFTAAAALDGKVYVFGGLDAAGKALATVEVYDPKRDSWSGCPSMGPPRSRLAAVNHMDRMILVGGGLDEKDVNSARVRVFLPREGIWRDIWREWSDLPTPRHGFGLVDAGDGSERVFAVGGYDDRGPLADVAVFDAGTIAYRWWPGPALDEPRGFHGLAAIGRRIYAVGGRRADIPRTEVLDMDAPSGRWKPMAPLPKDLCRFSMVEWDGHLLVFGGETECGWSVNTAAL